MSAGNLLLVSGLLVIASAVSGSEYFVLHHEELQSLSIDVEKGGSPSPGRSLAIRRHVPGLRLYVDRNTNTVRTADGDYCIHESGGILKLADCDNSNDWRYFRDRTIYVSALVHGGGNGGQPSRIAVWKSDRDLYKEGANVLLVSMSYAEHKNDYGAEWVQHYSSMRDVVARELASLLRMRAAVVHAQEEYTLCHVELRKMVVCTENGGPPTAGQTLVARYLQDPETGGIKFFENDQYGGALTTSDGGLCVIAGQSDSILQLTQCSSVQATDSLFRYYNKDRVYGIVAGSGANPHAIGAWDETADVMSHQDATMMAQPFDAYQKKYSAKFIKC